jgi:hypothetical protein
MITETLAALTGSQVPLDRLSLLYGNYFDLSAPFVEVATHWDGRGWLTPLPAGYPEGAWELGQAERRDAALAGGNLRAILSPERHLAEGPFTRGTTEIASGDASGCDGVLPGLLSASFTAGLTVRSSAAIRLPPPRFDLITDIELFFEGYARENRNAAATVRPADRRRTALRVIPARLPTCFAASAAAFPARSRPWGRALRSYQ